MERLIKGFQHFRANVFPGHRDLLKSLAAGQTPHTMIISCADSRVMPELFTGSDPGDLFVCRNVGNIVPPYAQFTGGVSAAIEYAVAVLKVENIVICGHSDCGAMKATMKPESTAKLPAVGAWLRHAEVAKYMVDTNYEATPSADKLAVLTEENVIAQLDHLRTHPAVAARLASGQLQIHGWVFDIEHGTVKAFSAEQRRFVPLEETAGGLLEDVPHATPPARFNNLTGEAL